VKLWRERGPYALPTCDLHRFQPFQMACGFVPVCPVRPPLLAIRAQSFATDRKRISGSADSSLVTLNLNLSILPDRRTTVDHPLAFRRCPANPTASEGMWHETWRHNATRKSAFCPQFSWVTYTGRPPAIPHSFPFSLFDNSVLPSNYRP
jgi:hypothetical protein